MGVENQNEKKRTAPFPSLEAMRKTGGLLMLMAVLYFAGRAL